MCLSEERSLDKNWPIFDPAWPVTTFAFMAFVEMLSHRSITTLWAI
jgi:hypothetical protein